MVDVKQEPDPQAIMEELHREGPTTGELLTGTATPEDVDSVAELAGERTDTTSQVAGVSDAFDIKSPTLPRGLTLPEGYELPGPSYPDDLYTLKAEHPTPPSGLRDLLDNPDFVPEGAPQIEMMLSEAVSTFKRFIAEEGGEEIPRIDTADLEKMLAELGAKFTPAEIRQQVQEFLARLSEAKGKIAKVVATMPAMYVGLTQLAHAGAWDVAHGAGSGRGGDMDGLPVPSDDSSFEIVDPSGDTFGNPGEEILARLSEMLAVIMIQLLSQKVMRSFWKNKEGNMDDISKWAFHIVLMAVTCYLASRWNVNTSFLLKFIPSLMSTIYTTRSMGGWDGSRTNAELFHTQQPGALGDPNEWKGRQPLALSAQVVANLVPTIWNWISKLMG